MEGWGREIGSGSIRARREGDREKRKEMRGDERRSEKREVG